MQSRVITWCTLAAFLATLSSCYTDETVSAGRLKDVDETIAHIITTDGDSLSFVLSGRFQAVVGDSSISGRLLSGSQVTIPLSRIHHVVVHRFNVGKTIVGVFLISAATALVVVALIAALKESCPFIYSYDGERFVFDGEPYGGAICEALKRTDWAMLEHLKPVDGMYRLRLTNEVPESQYTDEATLWVIDHDSALHVMMDDRGTAHTVAAPQAPVSVRDQHGASQLKWVSASDLLVWETDLRTMSPANPAGFRDTLRIAFLRPPGATQAKLVTHLGTTLWGSQMLRRMTELRGEQYRSWYEQLRSPATRAMLDAWNMREELYLLNVRVQTPRGWERRGVIPGGGPFMMEERAFPLDLAGIEGDTVNFLLTPAAGFWQIDRLAIDYSADEPVVVTAVSASKALADDGTDIRGLLLDTDQRYYVLPAPGRWAELEFPAPTPVPGCTRTVVAKVSGYYEMFLDAEGPPRTDLLRRIAEEPGFPVAFAVREFAAWRASMADHPAGRTERR